MCYSGVCFHHDPLPLCPPRFPLPNFLRVKFSALQTSASGSLSPFFYDIPFYFLRLIMSCSRREPPLLGLSFFILGRVQTSSTEQRCVLIGCFLQTPLLPNQLLLSSLSTSCPTPVSWGPPFSFLLSLFNHRFVEMVKFSFDPSPFDFLNPPRFIQFPPPKSIDSLNLQPFRTLRTPGFESHYHGWVCP